MKLSSFLGGAAVALSIVLVVVIHLMDGVIRMYYPKPSFSFDDVPDLSSKVFIVTGANAGVGFTTSEMLAKRGATVVMASRSSQKGQDAAKKVNEVAKQSRGGVAIAMVLDLTDHKSIKSFSQSFLAKKIGLHGLILNAGVMATPYGATKDGFELQVGTNWLGHFYLQQLLQKKLEESAPSRVVIVSSQGHEVTSYFGFPKDFDLLKDNAKTREKYQPWIQYGISKTANILHANELDRRMREKGIDVKAMSVHPGFVRTELQRHVVGEHKWSQQFLDVFNNLALPPHEGALSQVYAATSPEIDKKNLSGEYFVPLVRVGPKAGPAKDPQLAKQLWEFGESIIRDWEK